MITANTYDEELETIETSLKQAIAASEKIKDDYYMQKYAHGNLENRALLYLLDQNIKNNKQALINFLKLELY